MSRCCSTTWIPGRASTSCSKRAAPPCAPGAPLRPCALAVAQRLRRARLKPVGGRRISGVRVFDFFWLLTWTCDVSLFEEQERPTMANGIKIVTIGGGSSYTPELVEGFIKRYDNLPRGRAVARRHPEGEEAPDRGRPRAAHGQARRPAHQGDPHHRPPRGPRRRRLRDLPGPHRPPARPRARRAHPAVPRHARPGRPTAPAACSRPSAPSR